MFEKKGVLHPAIDKDWMRGYNIVVTLHPQRERRIARKAGRWGFLLLFCACIPLKDFKTALPLKGEPIMAEEKKVILTREGYEKLEKELDYYVSVRRNEISEQIAIARGFGDLSENAEYDEAKNEQSRIEAKIVEMENTLRNCIVVENDEVSTDSVGVGNTVKVMNETLKKEQVITIVGANETDPRNMKISSESPIGAALLGSKVGDVVSVEVPVGLMKMVVLEISR